MTSPGSAGGPAGDRGLADLLGQALAHRSWCSEHGGAASNERLEYLGDAVLGLVVAEDTFRTYPGMSDGTLSKVRASVVNARVLAELARGLGIPDDLRLGKGEDASGGRDKESILADILEIEPSTISESSSFAEDLDADSLALIELVEGLEEELGERSVGFRIADEDLEELRTVRDAVDYVEAKLGAS